MIPGTVDLGGQGWTIRSSLGGEWAWYLRLSPDQPVRPGALPARVPGSVIDDLWRAGELPDPYHGRDSRAAEWAPARSWLYEREIRLEAAGRATLRFAGLDHSGTVFLDGREVARHRGTFRPLEVELTGRDGGRHMLSVLVDPAPASESQTGRTSQVRVYKPRLNYGWDFCPRLVHQGLWGPVTLRYTGAARITGVHARPSLLDGDGGRVTVAVTTDGPLERSNAVLTDGGRVVASAEGGGDGPLVLDVPEPRRWWPNGLGPAHRYRLEVTAHTTGGEVSDRWVGAVGFRTVELVDGGFVVNGRRAPLNGWNWVPIDALYGVPRPAKLAHLLTLARHAHVNLLRVWGGGLLETPEFYDLTDRLGLMVWQEFSQSSSIGDSVPATDAGYVDAVVAEAGEAIRARRHHPSLVLWCGGNELADADGKPLTEDGSPVLAALGDTVRALDPDRLWLPTSPSGPGDEHGPWEHQGLVEQQGRYDGSTAWLASEFGVEGMANRRAHLALVPSGERWPATRDNPVYAHLGAWWNNAPLVLDCFGGRLDDLEALRRASQLLQHDGLRYAVESYRRRGAGTVPWQFNESYPNAWCTAVVDHLGDPKPAYHAVAAAYGPAHVCAAFARQAWAGEAEFQAAVWAWSRDEPRAGCAATARVVAADGTVLAETSWPLDLPGGPAAAAGDVRVPVAGVPTDLFVLDLALTGPDGRSLSRNRYLFSRTADLAPLLDLAVAEVAAEVTADGDHWRVRLAHRSGPVAAGLRLVDDRPAAAAGWAVSAAPVDLLPGETRTVPVTWRGAEPAGRRLTLEGWNVRARALG